MELEDDSMTRHLANKVFESAGGNRDEVGVIELRDCFAAAHLTAPNISGTRHRRQA